MASDVGNFEGFVDAIADRVLGKLTGRPNQGPTGEPLPQLPDLPWGRKDVPPLVVHSRLRVQGLEITQSTQYYGTGYGGPTIPCPSWRSSRWSCAPTPM
jgi:hypothetical protein